MRTVLASSALLPVLVAAVPFDFNPASVAKSANPANVAIPLTSAFTTTTFFLGSNGFVNLTKVENYIAGIQAKYVEDDGLSARSVIELHNSDNTQWTGEIAIGTPPRKFTAMFDTGSSDVVVPTSSGCNGCYQSVTYDPSSSSTSNALNSDFSLNYGSGAVSGGKYEDTVSFGGFTASKQTILAANNSAKNFFQEMNALVGLGFAATSSANVTPIVQNLRNQNQLSQPIFGFKLGQNDSELMIGGANTKLYKGKPTYVPVTSDKRWQINFDQMTLWDKTLKPKNKAAVIDSGTTLILADDASVTEFYSTVYGSSQLDNGMWQVYCINVPQVNVTFSGHKISIPSNVFTLGQISANSDKCLGGVQSASGLQYWVMGDILMRNAYTIFDAAQRRIGFADLK